MIKLKTQMPEAARRVSQFTVSYMEVYKDDVYDLFNRVHVRLSSHSVLFG